MRDFAKTLRRHAIGILAYYDCQITTGPLEGINNKIKTMKRQAYGFRDMEGLNLTVDSSKKKLVAAGPLPAA